MKNGSIRIITVNTLPGEYLHWNLGDKMTPAEAAMEPIRTDMRFFPAAKEIAIRVDDANWHYLFIE